MLICSLCQTQSPDSTSTCPVCGANLKDDATVVQALKRLKENPRVKAIRVSAPAHACPLCQDIQGLYSKDDVPVLPVEGCSNPQGCCSFYQPLLDEIYP